MRLSVRSILPVLAWTSTISTVAGQTFTDCNPTAQSNCPPNTALGTSKTISFLGGSSPEFTAFQTPTYGSDGAAFTVARQGDAPYLQSKWYIMFGHVEFVVRAAPGTGIVSSAILQSDCLDEIDFEWIGGDDQQVQSNWFGKGQTNTNGNHGAFHGAPNNHETFHTYAIDWTAEQIVWQVDGVTVRVATAADAGAGQYPQTPMHVRVGSWAGGDPSNAPGTIAWSGGPTDFSAGPYTMYIQSVKVTDYSTGSQYTYGDISGTWQSIQSHGGRINPGGSGTVVSSGNAPAVTSAVSGSAPLAWDPNQSASVYATRTGYPWVMDSATASVVTEVSSGYTSIAGLPSGWTTPPPSMSSPPASSPASSLASGHSVRTSFDEQGSPTTITYDPATATIPVSYDSQGFPIPPTTPGTASGPPPSSPTPSPIPRLSTSVAPNKSGSTPSSSDSAAEGISSASVAGSASSPTQGILRSSTLRSTDQPSRTTATTGAESTPAAPAANEASHKDIGLTVMVMIAAYMVF